MGVTSNDLGGDTEYGAPDTARFAETLISAPEANPQLVDCAA